MEDYGNRASHFLLCGPSSGERQIMSLLSASQRDVQTIFPLLPSLATSQAAAAQDFLPIAGSYTIFNLYEDSDAAIISKYSATLDLPAENFGARCHHRELLDLEGSDLVSEWLFQKLTSLGHEIPPATKEYRRFLHHLTSVEPMARQKESVEPHIGSLDWVNGLESYQKWINAKSISFLYIHGPPGSGVPICASNIVGLLRDKRARVDACYLDFSCRRQDMWTLSEENVMCSLVHQLLSQRPGLFRHTQPLCTWILENGCANIETLWGLFKSLLSHIGNVPILLAIRTVHEGDIAKPVAEIISRLSSIRRITSPDIKVIITSEGQDLIGLPTGDFHQISVQEVAAISFALKGLVQDRVQRLLRTRPAWRNLDNAITDKCWGVQGDYDWAMAKVQDLELASSMILSTREALIRSIDSIPQGNQDLFQRILNRIPDQFVPWLLEALRWVVFALRPLSVREFAVAVAFNQEKGNEDMAMVSFQDLEDRIFSDLPGDINRIAGYLVKVSCGTVEVANTALRSLLIDKFMSGDPREHAEMAKKCLKYISWVVKAIGIGNNAVDVLEIVGGHTACDLVEYAVNYWSFHYKFAGNDQIDIIATAQAFFKNPQNVSFLSTFLRYNHPAGVSSDFWASPLAIYAALGLGPLIEDHLSNMGTLSPDYQFTLIYHGISIAIERDHTDVALTLYRKFRDSNSLPPLHMAAMKGNVVLLKEFLEVQLIKESINNRDTHSYSPLFYAAQHGQREAAAFLLRNNAQPNLVGDDKWTAIHVACKVGCLSIVRLLIDYQADYRFCNKMGHSALHLAAEGGFDDLIAFLLPLYTKEDNEFISAETSTTPLHLAATYGHTSTCIQLINYGLGINLLDEEERTPIYLATLGRFPETTRALLEADCKPSADILGNKVTGALEQATLPLNRDSSLPEYGPILSPLQVAAEKGFVEIIHLLLEYSYFIRNFTYDCNEAICKAAIGGQWESIDTLLRYSDTSNPVNSSGDTALHVACKYSQGGLVERLLQSKKYDPGFLDGAGLASLHIAVREGCIHIISILLDEKWTEVDIRTSNGDMAMHIAARAGRLDVIEILQKYKDTSTEKNGKGETPMLLAAKAGHTDIVGRILSKVHPLEATSELLWGKPFPLHSAVSDNQEKLASILIQYDCKVDSVNADGEAPLHIAARLALVSMIEFLIRKHANPAALNSSFETVLLVAARLGKQRICQVIMDGFPDKVADFVDFQDQAGNSALYIACERGDEELVQLLLANEADPNKQCQQGWTPMHISAMNNNAHIMRLLYGAGADHDSKSYDGTTSIIIAAEKGHIEVIRLLLERGANVKAANSSGISAVYQAARTGHLDCVKLLIEAGADINFPKTNGLTPLYIAIYKENDDVANYLIDIGAGVNPERESLLQAAMTRYKSSIWKKFGHQFIKRRKSFILIQKNKEIIEKLVTAGTTMTVYPRYVASFSEPMLVFALEHPEAFKLDSPGRILQQAIFTQYRNAALMMIESGMSIDETGGPCHTALQAAAAVDSVDLMTKLLEKNADPNIRGGTYTSALNASIIRKNAEAVKLLLRHKAKTDIEQDGHFPLHRAIQQGSIDIVRTILDFQGNLDIKDKNGRSLLAYAIHSGHTSVVDYLLTRSDIRIHDPDLCGRTPLMTAVIFDKHDLVSKLLEMGADPNARDSEKKTPLIRAVASPKVNEATVLALLKHGADPSLKDCRNRGALYWACAALHVEIAMYIIIPALRRQGIRNLKGQFAFHAVAASKLGLAQPKTPDVQGIIFFRMLRDMWPRSEFDVEEEDDDGWTSTYTAMKCGNIEIEEGLVEALILFNFTRSLGRPKAPTEWHKDDKAPCLEVDDCGRTVTVRATPSNPDDLPEPRATIRANHCMTGDRVYYFEVTVNKDAHENIIGVGFCEEHSPLNTMVGCDPGSWGYHGNNGLTLGIQKLAGSAQFGEAYEEGDTVGCGVNFEKETAFFTKNGKLIGPAFYGMKGKVYPAVSFDVQSPGAAITANFGPDGFLYKEWKPEENTINQTRSEKGDLYESDLDVNPEWDRGSPLGLAAL
ncbi:hypothetical protein Hte_004566 [Hypoxylon texense]